MKTSKVAILGATGMVGQRYVRMLSNHPFFKISCLTGGQSAGKLYCEATKWLVSEDIPKECAVMEVKSTEPNQVDADLVFSALPSDVARKVEGQFAEAGFKVFSEASANRMQPDVPLVIPEVNAEHLKLTEYQKKNRGWDGFIVTGPNCTTVGLAMVLKPLVESLPLEKAVVCTMQAISGAGYPGIPSLAITDNAIPFIEGEEEKVESEVRKLLGRQEEGVIEPSTLLISAMCNRVPVTDGHLESLYLEADSAIDPDQARLILEGFKGLPQELNLPTAPEKPIIVRGEPDRPQPKLDRLAGSVPGMSVVVGRVRKGMDDRSLRMTVLTHNTIRGAAGTNILTAELMAMTRMLEG